MSDSGARHIMYIKFNTPTLQIKKLMIKDIK